MVTVLALLGVLGVLFAAAVLSTRDEGLLADVAPDAADVPLPEEPLRPEDVGQLRFSLAARGYRMSEVDLALERLAAELADRDRRIALLEAAAEGHEEPVASAPVREATPADLPAPEPVPPVVPEPVVSEPVVSEPVVSEPVVSEPVVSEPVVSEPVVTEPVVTEPVVTEPVVTEPVVTEPVVSEPVAPQPPAPVLPPQPTAPPAATPAAPGTPGSWSTPASFPAFPVIEAPDPDERPRSE